MKTKPIVLCSLHFYPAEQNNDDDDNDNNNKNNKSQTELQQYQQISWLFIIDEKKPKKK